MKYRWISLGSFVLVSARRSRTLDFCGFSPIDATNASASSSSSTLRPTMPVATRVERTHTTPFLACAASALTAGAVRLPLPTPATTTPFAPAATAASISAPSMFS